MVNRHKDTDTNVDILQLLRENPANKRGWGELAFSSFPYCTDMTVLICR